MEMLTQEDVERLIHDANRRLTDDEAAVLAWAFRKGETYTGLERQMNLAGQVPPVCRNTYYRIRREVLARIAAGAGQGEQMEANYGNDD